MISSWIWSCARRNGPEPRHQPVRGERRPDRQLDHAAGLRAGRRHRGFGAQRRRRHRLDMFAELAALRGQRQAFVGAREQGNAELAFQFGDLAADRRMAGAQLARRRGETAGFGHRDEGLAQVPVHRLFPRRQCSLLNDHLFNIEQPRRPVQPYNGPQQVVPGRRFCGPAQQIKTSDDAFRAIAGRASKGGPNAVARFACQFARTAGGRLAAVHRVRARTRHRPVQGRNRRLVSGAERPPGRKARRMADPDRERARRIQGAAPGRRRSRPTRSTRSATPPTTG